MSDLCSPRVSYSRGRRCRPPWYIIAHVATREGATSDLSKANGQCELCAAEYPVGRQNLCLHVSADASRAISTDTYLTYTCTLLDPSRPAAFPCPALERISPRQLEDDDDDDSSSCDGMDSDAGYAGVSHRRPYSALISDDSLERGRRSRALALAPAT
nr:hypothetical protein CFP56_73873 [Quercus suber]